jgi:nitrite reductase/ring-hydroxylating ferredoxin subunit
VDVAGEQVICRSDALEEGGGGVRFTVLHGGREVPAFVVRYSGAAHAYENRCAHVPVQLDWEPGVFFDHSGLHLVCATHGATYEPETGRCIAGPCKGRRLRKLSVTERDGEVLLLCGEGVAP